MLQFKIESAEDINSFVGIRIQPDSDGTQDKVIQVCLPHGFVIKDDAPAEDKKRDVRNFINVLSLVSREGRGCVPQLLDIEATAKKFPLNAYLEIIRDYICRGTYYTETETVHCFAEHGRINWQKTISQVKPFVRKKGDMLFPIYVIRKETSATDRLITQIHKYCVYESFNVFGWLFKECYVAKPDLKIECERFVSILRDKLSRTYNDNDKRLLSAMISVLRHIDRDADDSDCFGTKNFEYVWQILIDKVFGIEETKRKKYNPTTRWYLTNEAKKNSEARPDTIMQHRNTLYVLDAKYYKYGVTENALHLPLSESINKQVMYAENVYKKNGQKNNVRNAFLMPYKSKSCAGCGNFSYIGFAAPDWKKEYLDYDRILGILVDTRYLIEHYLHPDGTEISELSKFIEDCITTAKTVKC